MAADPNLGRSGNGHASGSSGGRGLLFALQHAKEMLAGRSTSRASSRSVSSSQPAKSVRSRADSHGTSSFCLDPTRVVHTGAEVNSTATPSTTSRTRVSHEDSRGELNDTHGSPSPKPRLPSPPPTLPMPRFSWHCRVCSNEPREPTVTMCGHLFCRR